MHEPDQKLSPSDASGKIVLAIEEHYVEYLRGLALTDRVEWNETKDEIWFRSGIRASWLNRVMRFGAVDDENRIRSAIDRFRGLPFQWFYGPSTDVSILRPLLEGHGMSSMGEEIGMVADLSRPETSASETGLDIRPVRDRNVAGHWSLVLNDTFGFSDEVGALYRDAEIASLERGLPRFSFVGYIHDRPTTIGTLFLSNGVAGVMTIGTVPEARCQGYGSAMVRFLLSEARKRDYALGVLMASEMGAGVYRRQGFEKVCNFYRYEGRTEELRS